MNPVYNGRARSLYRGFSDYAVGVRQREMSRLQEQMSSGRQINRPSDDPGGWAQARRAEALSDRFDQFERSLGSARSWTDATQAALDDLANLYTQAYEEGVRYASDTFSAEDRAVAAESLRSVRDAVLERMNTQHNGEYLFAGSRSTAEPFQEVPGPPPTIAYNGDDRPRTRHVGPGLELDLNTTGDDLEALLTDANGTFSALQALDELITALDTNAPTVGDAVGRVVQARDHVLTLGVRAGTVGARLDDAEGQLQDGRLRAERDRSTLEDADYAQTITDFQRAQNGLQAAYQVTASVLQTSILDYLR